MNVPGCNVTYRHPTLALHLHDYTGVMWIGTRRIALEPGDITLSPGGRITSRYALKESGQHLCLHIAPPALREPRCSFRFTYGWARPSRRHVSASGA